MTGLCKNGHVTGQRKCGTCGADRVPNSHVGLGRVNVKHQRPRDANGRNELDELRRETRVSRGVGVRYFLTGQLPPIQGAELVF